jgi:hypothetical protein
MGDYGIKISLDGVDVKTATPEQCTLHSGYACPKIKLNQSPAHFGVYTKTFASTPAVGETILTTINHGLGYKPMNLVMIKYHDGVRNRAMPLPAQSGISLQIYAYATTTDLKIAINRSAGGTDPTGETWVFKYYIFVENGA